MNLRASILILLPLGLFACKQAYVPPVVSTSRSYLVVEGFINNGPDSTYITLSHTFKLSDTAKVTPELHARLTVEGKDNSSYPLTEWGNGQYGVPGLTLNNAVSYRLHIRTAAGKEYVSEYIPLKVAPPIDSVSWERTRDGVQIYVNTHDPQNASRYYRWDWLAVWEFHSAFYQIYKYENGQFLNNDPNLYYTCWKSAVNTNIQTASTTQLVRDEVYKFPLVLIPSDSWLISVRYSILVRQYALTQEAFNFWDHLKKNSEQIGSIFSPQPTENTTNFHAVADSSELVTGFISAGTRRQQRIFILPTQIPDWRIGSYANCEEMDTRLDSVRYWLRDGSYSLIDSEYSAAYNGFRYNFSTTPCIKCTLTGTNIKPSFW